MNATQLEDSVPDTAFDPPVYREIPLSQLTVDRTYQREVDARWVKRTAKVFDPALLGVLMVASNGGDTFTVWDGQHRLEMLKLLGVPSVMCQVTNADRQEQAALFSRQVNRRNLRWMDRHRSRLAAGDYIAQQVDGIVGSQGLVLAVGGKNAQAIQAIKSVYWIYNRYGAEVLTDTLELVAKAWVGSPQRFSDRVLMGVATFYAAFPPGDDAPHAVERDMAIKVFQEVAPSRILDDASKLSRTPTGSNNYTAFATLLVKHFNHRTGRRLRADRLGNKP